MTRPLPRPFIYHAHSSVMEYLIIFSIIDASSERRASVFFLKYSLNINSISKQDAKLSLG